MGVRRTTPQGRWAQPRLRSPGCAYVEASTEFACAHSAAQVLSSQVYSPTSCQPALHNWAATESANSTVRDKPSRCSRLHSWSPSVQGRSGERSSTREWLSHNSVMDRSPAKATSSLTTLTSPDGTRAPRTTLPKKPVPENTAANTRFDHPEQDHPPRPSHQSGQGSSFEASHPRRSALPPPRHDHYIVPREQSFISVELKQLPWRRLVAVRGLCAGTHGSFRIVSLAAKRPSTPG